MQQAMALRKALTRRSRRAQEPSMLTAFAMGFLAFAVYVYMYSHQRSRQDLKVAFLSWFRDHGGWISPSVTLGETEYGNGLLVQRDVERLEKILEIPVDLVITQASATSKLGSNEATHGAFMSTIDAINKELIYPMDRQDAWIALELLLECCSGSASQYTPYLNILPSKIPRLASFSSQEFDVLQDEDLAQYGRSQYQALERVWEAAKELFLSQGTVAEECLTSSAFHHYVAISASRAMILNGTKYLTPMAEMINHSDNPDSDVADFQGHHKLESGKLVVYADRPFRVGQELVEEYGKLDNSLYISAFGFVPENNPHHCVFIENVCVKGDGQPADASQQAALRKIALTNCSGEDEDCGKQQNERVRHFLQRFATRKLSSYATTLEEDLALLAQVKPEGSGMDHDKVRVAMQFRIEEKKVFMRLAEAKTVVRL